MRIAVSHRDPDALQFLDTVGIVVDHHVEPGAEQVLVIRSAESGGDLRGVRVLVAGVGGGEHDSRCLDLELDRPVEVEVPEEAVVVIADGGEERDDQTPLSAGLVGAGPQVGVLPEDAVILLVHAHRVSQRVRGAALVGDDRIEVGDVADAVATEFEGIGVTPDEVFAGVEVVLPRTHRRRIAVGHNHLRDRRAVDDRTHPTAVGEADLMQDETFAGVETDSQTPLLPLDEVSGDGEARTLRLGDGDGFCVVRSGPVTSGSAKLPDSCGIGTTPRSRICRTSRAVTSTKATNPSIGCARRVVGGLGLPEGQSPQDATASSPG